MVTWRWLLPMIPMAMRVGSTFWSIGSARIIIAIVLGSAAGGDEAAVIGADLDARFMMGASGFWTMRVEGVGAR